MKVSSNKLSDNIKFYTQRLQTVFDGSESRTLIHILVESFFGYSKLDLVSNDEIRLSESEMLKLHFAVKELLNNKPVQYVTGEAFFADLKLSVNEAVLIPRPETEELIELILNDLKSSEDLKCLDIGTGSGCIPLSLKHRKQSWEVCGIDVSLNALEVARKNANGLDLNVQFENFDVFNKDQMKDLGLFDVMISNPPYIKENEKTLMKKNVLEHEPEQALFVPNEDPLKFYTHIAKLGRVMLKNRGLIYFEINEAHGEEMLEMMHELGYRQILLKKDFNDKDRFVCALK